MLNMKLNFILLNFRSNLALKLSNQAKSSVRQSCGKSRCALLLSYTLLIICSVFPKFSNALTCLALGYENYAFLLQNSIALLDQERQIVGEELCWSWIERAPALYAKLIEILEEIQQLEFDISRHECNKLHLINFF